MEIASWFPLYPSPTYLPTSWFTHPQARPAIFPFSAASRNYRLCPPWFSEIILQWPQSELPALPEKKNKPCLLCDITLPNYKLAPSLIPARVLIEKAKQIPNKHSSKGLVSKHSLTAFLVGVTPCWHLAGAFHNFWTWMIFTSGAH